MASKALAKADFAEVRLSAPPLKPSTPSPIPQTGMMEITLPGGTLPAVAYIYSSNRRAEHPGAHLAGFRGVLQVDGYHGFKALRRDRRAGSGNLHIWDKCIFCLRAA